MGRPCFGMNCLAKMLHAWQSISLLQSLPNKRGKGFDHIFLCISGTVATSWPLFLLQILYGPKRTPILPHKQPPCQTVTHHVYSNPCMPHIRFSSLSLSTENKFKEKMVILPVRPLQVQVSEDRRP